jgi:thiamine-monophosphate kinase
MDMNQHKPIAQIGEKSLIRMIMEEIDSGDVLVGNEDCVGVLLGKDSLLVVNIDTLYWPSDIPTKVKMTMSQGGGKAVMMTISDLAAKGVKPKGFISSIGAPPTTNSTDILDLVRGMRQGAKECGTRYLGGDLSEAAHLIVSGVAFGVVHPQKAIKRATAHPGDAVFITGEFLTGAGFKITVDGLKAPPELYRLLVQPILSPKARVREGIALGESGVVTACIDSSDGLARSLYELAEASNVGIQIHHLPIPNPVMQFASIHQLDPTELVLYGGEEYELVFTVPKEKISQIGPFFKELECPVTQIGEVTPSSKILLNEEELDPKGYEHFISPGS